MSPEPRQTVSPAPPALCGALADMRRHPLKGFTAEAVEQATLTRAGPFPADRLFAVEAGDCGFDPEAPGPISKFKFAVLANTAAVARIHTRFEGDGGRLRAEAEGAEPFTGSLAVDEDRARFEDWLTAALGEEAPSGRLRVIPGKGWRFFDAPDGHVSIINLESVRDLARHVGAPLDPLRFRANLYVEGWPAWAEMDLPAGTPVTAGGAQLEMIRPIRRCAAIHVDPVTARRDHELVRALHTAYGHMFCGIYLRVKATGVLKLGDDVKVRA